MPAFVVVDSPSRIPRSSQNTRRICAPNCGCAQIDVEAHATDRKHKAADATSTAVCARNAILDADAELKTTPGNKVTEDVSKPLRKEFEVSEAVARTEVKLCLSEDDVYWLGWYEQAIDSMAGLDDDLVGRIKREGARGPQRGL